MNVKAGLVVAVTLALFGVAGCGGGRGDVSTASPSKGSEGSVSQTKPTGPPLSKAFMKKAEAICEDIPRNYSAKLSALEAEAKKKGQKLTKSQETLEAAVPPVYTGIKELEELVPPAHNRAKVEAIIDALRAAARGLEEEPEAELLGPKSPYAEFEQLTKEYGFKICSQL